MQKCFKFIFIIFLKSQAFKKAIKRFDRTFESVSNETALLVRLKFKILKIQNTWVGLTKSDENKQNYRKSEGKERKVEPEDKTPF